MSFRWTRSAGTLTSTCTLCATTITGRRDNDVTFAQRGHDAFTCQMQRAQTARAGDGNGIGGCAWENRDKRDGPECDLEAASEHSYTRGGH